MGLPLTLKIILFFNSGTTKEIIIKDDDSPDFGITTDKFYNSGVIHSMLVKKISSNPLHPTTLFCPFDKDNLIPLLIPTPSGHTHQCSGCDKLFKPFG